MLTTMKAMKSLRTTQMMFQGGPMLNLQQSMYLRPSPSMWMLTSMPQRYFTGKTEDGYKWRTPKLRLRKVKRIPAPGLNLKIPADLDAETFLRQIGGDCDDIADKFESIDEIFTESTYHMKKRGVPVKQRKYIRRCVEQLRAGVLTFEYLGRRTCLDRVRD